MTPEMLSKMVSNPELMVLMQNAKLQEIMKKVRFAQTGNACKLLCNFES